MPQFFDFDGKYYMIPGGFMPVGLFYNRRLFAEAGLTEQDMPRTWDDLVTVGKKLAEKDAQGNLIREGLAMKGVESIMVNIAQVSLGGYLFTDEYGTESNYNSPQTKEAAQFIYDLFYKHKIASLEFPVFIESWASELAGMCWMSTFLGGYTDQAVPELNWGLAPAPLPGVDRMPELSAWTMVTVSFDIPVVSAYATAEEKEAAFTLLRFLIDDEEFMVNTAKALSVIPSRIDLLTRPEFQTPINKVVTMLVDYGVYTGEDVVDLKWVLHPKWLERILLEHLPIDEALDQAKAEGDKILKKLGIKYRITERFYTHPGGTAMEDWRSGKMAFPFK
jgi:multiple sugar transport system substrate-binding protein